MAMKGVRENLRSAAYSHEGTGALKLNTCFGRKTE